MSTRSQSIAERIRLSRRLAGLTQEEAAQKLGVAVRTYARWESCATEGFLEELERIAAAFGTAVAELAPEGEGDGASLEAKVDRVLDELAELRAFVEGLAD